MFNAASQVTKQQRKKVIVTIHDAARLRSTQMFGKQDPYVIVYVKGANQRRRVKTHVNEDGGKNPAWNQTLASLDYIHADKSDRIVFEVWNENSMSDSLIGQAVCNLSELFNPTERSVNLPVLVDGKRSGSSTVRVSAHFSDIKTISQVGASLLQQAVSQPPNSTQASARRPSMVSITSRSVPPPPQLPTSASAPSGSAQWAVGPKSSSEETSPPQAPQTVQPPQQPTSSTSSSTTKATVEIVIPKGVKSGNTITVNLPDGRTIKVTVPQGMKPGNKLTINYDVVPKPNRFKAAVARATGPSVSIGQGVTPGLAPSGSFNNNTGTGIGFRSGYQAKTAATVGMAANRFRNGLSQPSSAPVATVAPVMAVVQPVLSSANYVPQQPSYSNQYARQGSSGSFGQVQQPTYQQPSYQQPSYQQQPSYPQQQPSYSQQPSYPGQFQRQGSSGSYGGKYSKRRSEHREWSIVVDILIISSSFKPVSLSLSRISSILKHPHKSFLTQYIYFEYIWTSFYTHSITLFFFFIFNRPSSCLSTTTSSTNGSVSSTSTGASILSTTTTSSSAANGSVPRFITWISNFKSI